MRQTKAKSAGTVRAHGRAIAAVALALALVLSAAGAHAAQGPVANPVPGAPAPAPAPQQPSSPPPSGISIQFTQLNWLADDHTVRVPYSRVGVATLTFDSATATQLASQGAFFNLSTVIDGQVHNSVRNLYLYYRDAKRALASHPSVQFAIASSAGAPVSSLQFSYTLTATAVVTKVVTKQPTNVAVVLHSDYLVGGLRGGGSGLASTPDTIGDWIGPAVPVTEVYFGETWVGTDDLPAVSEDDEGCAPGSVARSIRYMADNWDLDGPTAQEIYGDLYRYMGTGEDGTDDDDIVAGKEDYVDDNELPIDTGSYFWDDVDLDDLADNLDNGGDVEVLIAWNPEGGHAAMVTSIVRLSDGTYEITYIDDGTQGDGVATNAEHTIYVDADGDFAGGSIIGFISEYMDLSPFFDDSATTKRTRHGAFKTRIKGAKAAQAGLCRASDLRSEIFSS
jgi:hypothetical protein